MYPNANPRHLEGRYGRNLPRGGHWAQLRAPMKSRHDYPPASFGSRLDLEPAVRCSDAKGNSHPFFSVLIPYRNVARFLRKCLTSLRRQSFGEWEALLYDDCSDDGSQEVARACSAGDRRFRFLASRQRRTALPNLMEMVRCAKGEVVYVLDGDDWLKCSDALATVRRRFLDGARATYGSFEYYPGGQRGHTRPMRKGERFYESWFYGHPLSWERDLSLESFEEEPDAYLDPDTREPYCSAYDLAVFFPIAARVAPVHIQDVTYIYRRHDRNDDQIDPEFQYRCVIKISQYWRRRCG